MAIHTFGCKLKSMHGATEKSRKTGQRKKIISFLLSFNRTVFRKNKNDNYGKRLLWSKIKVFCYSFAFISLLGLYFRYFYKCNIMLFCKQQLKKIPAFSLFSFDDLSRIEFINLSRHGFETISI